MKNCIKTIAVIISLTCLFLSTVTAGEYYKYTYPYYGFKKHYYGNKVNRPYYHGYNYPGTFVRMGTYPRRYYYDYYPGYGNYYYPKRTYWVKARYGHIPYNAVRQGYRKGNKFYLCKAFVRGKYRKGRLYKGDACYVRNVRRAHYKVLVR